LIINRASADPRFADHPGLTQLGIESYIAVPLNRRDGTYFGTLCALDPLPSTLDEQDLEIFQLLANLIAFELQADDQRRQREQELQDARQAAAIRERFIGVLGHELRTPLVAIKGLSQLVLRRPELSDRSRANVSRIVTSADQMNRLVTDLVDFARGRLGSEMPIHPAPADLAEICCRCINDVAIEHPHRRVRLETHGDLSGEWDPDRITQVVTNLVSNAVKFSPRDSPIVVIARSEEDLAILEVHNQGKPIPTDEIALIFDPFQRGSSERLTADEPRGLGLGLSIVQQIVHAHGGTVAVRSSASDGTVFTVSLPLWHSNPFGGH
jgi:signal transduction histidine kinase